MVEEGPALEILKIKPTCLIMAPDWAEEQEEVGGSRMGEGEEEVAGAEEEVVLRLLQVQLNDTLLNKQQVTLVMSSPTVVFVHV